MRGYRESPDEPAPAEHGRHRAAAPTEDAPSVAPQRRPGSDGERRLQQRLGTADRAERFYDEQVLDHVNERMREFIGRQEMFFLATSDASGECDSSFRAGPAGFLQVLGERTLAFPEYRGNGVHASLGNIEENPHLGILMIDFTRARIGLHVNGSATIVEDAEMRASYPDLPEDSVPGRRAQVWVRVEVEEAYIHCAKHIPQLQKAPRRTARDWGTDDYKRKGGDFFGVARDRREERAVEAPPVPEPFTAERVTPERVTPEPAAPEPVLPERVTPDPAAPERVTPEPALAEAQESPGTPEPLAPVTPLAPVASADPAPEPSRYDEPLAPVPDRPGDPDRPAAPDRPGADRPGVPAQRSAPDRRLADVSIASNASLFFGSVASADAGESRTARPQETPRVQQPYAFDMSASDPRAWREEAERALAEAQRRGAMSDAGSFGGWFG